MDESAEGAGLSDFQAFAVRGLQRRDPMADVEFHHARAAECAHPAAQVGVGQELQHRLRHAFHVMRGMEESAFPVEEGFAGASLPLPSTPPGNWRFSSFPFR
jgi:hypothetical protein